MSNAKYSLNIFANVLESPLKGQKFLLQADNSCQPPCFMPPPPPPPRTHNTSLWLKLYQFA